MRLGTQFYLCGGGEVPPSREELSRVDTVAGRGAAVRWGGGGLLSGGQHKWAGERGADQLYHDQLGRVTQDWIDCLTSNLKQFIICRNFIALQNQLTWKATMLLNFKFHGWKVLPGVKQNCGRQFAHCKYCICNTLHQFYTYVKVYKSLLHRVFQLNCLAVGPHVKLSLPQQQSLDSISIRRNLSCSSILVVVGHSTMSY